MMSEQQVRASSLCLNPNPPPFLILQFVVTIIHEHGKQLLSPIITVKVNQRVENGEGSSGCTPPTFATHIVHTKQTGDPY